MYIKIYPPPVQKEKEFIELLNKFFNNFPTNIVEQNFSRYETIVLSGNDKYILNSLKQQLDINKYKYEELNHINEECLGQKRLLIVVYPEKPQLQLNMFLYSFKENTELTELKQYNSSNIENSDLLEIVKCSKCGNDTPSELMFCLCCAEDFCLYPQRQYILKINRFLDKNISKIREEIKTLLYKRLHDLNLKKLDEVINSPLPFSLTFITSQHTAEFIKKELESYNIDCCWFKPEGYSDDFFEELIKFLSKVNEKNYDIGIIKDTDTIFEPSTIQLIKNTIKNIKSHTMKQILISCFMEILVIISSIKSSEENTNVLLEEILNSIEKLLQRMCKLLVKGDQIESYLVSNNPKRIEREIERILYQADSTNDNIAKETYLQAIKTKQKELERFENLKLFIERLQAQIINGISLFSSIRTEIARLLLIDTDYSKDGTENIGQLMEELKYKFNSIEEIMRTTLEGEITDTPLVSRSFNYPKI